MKNIVKLFSLGAASFVVPVIIILMIVNIVTGGYKIPENSLTDNLVKERLSPFESRTNSNIVATSQNEVLVKSGEQIYQAICQSCHSIGLVGAPKFADNQAWASRLIKGTETLYSNAINGINAMPAKGGSVSTPDDDIKKAVDYMLSNL
jgi:cytochrome c5